MKKVLSLVLAIVFMFALAIPAFAVGVKDSTGGDMTVNYQITQTYTISLPTELDVTGTQKAEAVTSVTVEFTEVYLNYGNTVGVSVAPKTEASFTLTDTANAENTWAYTISDSEGAVTKGVNFLEVAAGTTAGGSDTLTAATNETVTKAGTYSQIVTFTVAIETPTP